MGIMHLLLSSMALVGFTVAVCQLLRSVARWKVRSGLAQDLLVEVVSTLQLSCCTREMFLFGTLGGIQPWQGLALTYLLTVVHCLTFQGATCNPCGSLEQWLRAQSPGSHIILRVAAQFIGAALSRVLMPNIWLLGFSPLHEWKDGCRSPLNMAPWQGALVEMTCALSLFLAMHFLPRVKSQYRPHVVALTITAIVYEGGPRTGALFNPALAFAVVFLCQGNSLVQYILVYWVGPIIGTVVSIVILERCIPKLKRDKTSHVKRD
ncbi:aquaporin-11 [Bufo gargarizans]|uniref:aquaporin-11 n=1 Tax=Bufo bufo TaxID=8384 RepID=UPI001ABECB5A|nr:aquaporin-11 [Bufo bufo]XP_040282351.1 aquaporin-11 [Bufo bufo]XP_044143274.1 aquaporin-11 [Bufo gargarizans]